MSSSDPQRHRDMPAEQAKIDFAYDWFDRMIGARGRLADGAAHPRVAWVFENLAENAVRRPRDSDSLCVGRIDLEDGGPIYVGRFSVFDERDSAVNTWGKPGVWSHYVCFSADEARRAVDAAS